MRKLFFLTLSLFALNTFAQAPEKMSYQAVVRNTTNNLVTNQPVGMQISILQGSATGTAVYVETQTPTSNANGLVTLEIGGGTVVSGNLATINWANGPYFIKTETDPTGGSSYTITGTSQLLSAPYALYAKTSGSSTPGPQGPQGPQGPAGANGLDGATGPTGPQGPAGANGLDGVTGPMGPQGPQGLTGPQGPAGANGLDGVTGPMGPQGPQGLTGPQGPVGASGANGLDGATGPMGPQGSQGLTGATGPMGPQGPMGEQGIAGPQGPAGMNGLDGATGPMGPQGPMGEQGVAGPQGPAGATGATGATGPVGPQGPAGATGQGVPAGGTTGQVLAKVNATDFNTQWVTPSASASAYPNVELSVINTAIQNIPDLANATTNTVLTFSTTNNANASLTGGNNWNGSVFTVGSTGAGWYQINAQVVGVTATGTISSLGVLYFMDKNNTVGNNKAGALYHSNLFTGGNSNDPVTRTASHLNTFIYLNAGDNIRFRAYSPSVTSGQSSNTAADGRTFLNIVRIK